MADLETMKLRYGRKDIYMATNEYKLASSTWFRLFRLTIQFFYGFGFDIVKSLKIADFVVYDGVVVCA